MDSGGDGQPRLGSEGDGEEERGRGEHSEVGERSPLDGVDDEALALPLLDGEVCEAQVAPPLGDVVEALAVPLPGGGGEVLDDAPLDVRALQVLDDAPLDAWALQELVDARPAAIDPPGVGHSKLPLAEK